MPASLNKTLICALILSLTAAPTGAQDAPAPKSPKKAALLSLLIPGTGELYAGGPRSGRFFLFTEATFWTGLIAFRTLASARESTFKSFAASHAGAQTEGKPNSYFDELVQYQSIYARNTRARYVDGESAALRPETPDNIWEWDSEASRLKFQNLRSRETSARQKSLLFAGALIFNRFASAINAAHIARNTQPPGRVQMGLGPTPEGGARAWLRTSF